MSGDHLTIRMSLLGFALGFVAIAMSAAGWNHWAFIVSMFGAAGVTFLMALFWPMLTKHVGIVRKLQSSIDRVIGTKFLAIAISVLSFFPATYFVTHSASEQPTALAPATSHPVVQPIVKDDSILMFPAFSKAAKETGALIGEPIAPVGDSLGVYQVWLEQGNVIWLENPGVMCGIDNGAHGNKFLCTNDAFHAIKTEPNLFKESYVKSKLKLARKDYWPRGSLAYAMIQHADQWDWLGKAYIQCQLDYHQVHYQKFTGGVIYGPFRATARDDLEAAFFYVLLTNGRSHKILSDVMPPTNIGCDGD